MKLSESLRRGIMKSSVGGIINNLEGKKRRTTLFFENILADYVKLCEDEGYGDDIERIGEEWTSIGTKHLGKLSVFKSILLFNYAAKIVWSNLGLIDDFLMEKRDDELIVKTKNEFITRTIGKNRFIVGVIRGFLQSYFGKKVILLDSKASGEDMHYTFRLTGEIHTVHIRNKEQYNKLNERQSGSGVTLKNALQSRILTLKDKNRIYFRDRPLIPVENTVFHIIGNKNILMDRVPAISFNFFKGIVNETAPPEKNILLLKTLMQATGWCNVKIMLSETGITMQLTNLPVGLQEEQDNWIFLTNVITGYLWIMDKRYRMEKVLTKQNKVYLLFNKAR